jgi:hypothetical protein
MVSVYSINYGDDNQSFWFTCYIISQLHNNMLKVQMVSWIVYKGSAVHPFLSFLANVSLLTLDWIMGAFQHKHSYH